MEVPPLRQGYKKTIDLPYSFKNTNEHELAH